MAGFRPWTGPDMISGATLVRSLRSLDLEKDGKDKVTDASVLKKVDKERRLLNTIQQRKLRCWGMCLEMKFDYKTSLTGE